MARFLAFEYDTRQLRLLDLSGGHGKLTLSRCEEIDLPVRDDDSNEQPWEAVVAILRREQRARCSVLVSVPRSMVELRQFDVPSVTDAELPEVVRLQAYQQFSALTEDWHLDFLPLAAGTQATRKILAAALPAQAYQGFEKACRDASLELRSLILRPCASIALMQSLLRLPADGATLLIERLADELNLSVAQGSVLIYTRSVRLTASDQEVSMAARVVRSTLLSTQQSGQHAVDRIVLFGGESDREFVANLSKETGRDIQLLDPFGLVDASAAGQPPHPGRFAALLGMAANQLAPAPVVDFVNVRRQEPRAGGQRMMAAAALVGLALLLTLIGGAWWRLRGMDQQVTGLQRTVQRVRQQADLLQPQVRRDKALHEWSRGDPVWLDELERLASRFPSSDMGRLVNLELRSQETTALVSLESLVKRPQIMNLLENELRDDHREVLVRGGRQSRDDDYPWRFEATMQIRLPASTLLTPKTAKTPIRASQELSLHSRPRVE